ncbi:MAG: hypothetical protein E5V27_17985 [Mesorhizobium sp.]|nr:MAG: hypothetical protein E5V27_17985 [Mesorhizobium sp.]
MRAIMALALAVACSPFQAWAEEFDTTGNFAGSYLCIGEAAGGVIFDKDQKRWRGAVFDVSSNKFVVNVKALGVRDAPFAAGAEPAMQYNISVRPFGGEEYPCQDRIHDGAFRRELSLSREGRVHCIASLRDIIFSFSALRYMSPYAIGFVTGIDGPDDFGNSPNLEVGECSRIN